MRQQAEAVPVSRLLRKPMMSGVPSGRCLSLFGLAVASALFALALLAADAGPADAATNLRQVEVGASHACLLDSDGLVTCWGDDAGGKVSDWGRARYRNERFSQVSAGSFLTCGIKTNGSLMCWGHPELEDGTNREANNIDWDEWLAWQADPTGSAPTNPATGSPYTGTPNAFNGYVNMPPESVKFRAGSLSAGTYHACAIKTDGTMACWGKTSSARLVIPKDGGEAITDWLMVEAGHAHACGIRGTSLSDGGSVTCWGRTSSNRSAGPTGAGPFIDVTLATYNGCALAADGSVECWGGRASDLAAHNPTINTAPAGVTFTSIEMSTGDLNFHGCGLADDGRIYCWGIVTAVPHIPRTVPPGGSFASISVGTTNSCAVDAGNYLTCWGDQNNALFMPPSGQFKKVDGGSDFSCAIRTDDTVVCWGGIGYTADYPRTGAFKKLAVGDFHACGIKADDTVQCWGGVQSAGPPVVRLAYANPPSGTFKDIDAGPDLTCGVKTDGTLECWGATTHNRQTEPTGTFDRVAVGSTHVCAIKTSDKSIECWGEAVFFDREGDGTPDDIGGKGNHTSTTPPSGAHRYVDITAGEGHTCAIREDKKAVCWGYHADGRYAVPGYGRDAQGFGNVNYADIATGGNPNCAIREDNGKLSCWNTEKSQYLPSAEIQAMSGFKSLGAGSSHMCAIGSGDGLVCWGSATVIPYPSAYWPPLTVWESDMTVNDLGGGKSGCDNTDATDATGANHCVALLTDDDFVIDGVNYGITKLYYEPAAKVDYLDPTHRTDHNLYVTFDQPLPESLRGTRMCVGPLSFTFGGRRFNVIDGRTMHGYGTDISSYFRTPVRPVALRLSPGQDCRQSGGTGTGGPPPPDPTVPPPPPPPTDDGTATGTGTGTGGGGGFGPVSVPEFAEGARTVRTVPENAAPGDPVGKPVTATDPTGGALTYVIRNPDESIFTVDPDTGQITIKEGVDIAEGETYTFLLIARSLSGALAFIDVTVNVTAASCHPYDFNCNGIIELDEALAAVRDYFANVIDLDTALEVVRLYFAG